MQLLITREMKWMSVLNRLKPITSVLALVVGVLAVLSASAQSELDGLMLNGEKAASNHQVTSIDGVTSGSTLTGSVRLGATVTGQPDKVVFNLKGPSQQVVVRTANNASFALDAAGRPTAWDTASVPSGQYTLTVSAMAEGMPTRSRSVTFSIFNNRPSNLTKPEQTGTLSASPADTTEVVEASAQPASGEVAPLVHDVSAETTQPAVTVVGAPVEQTQVQTVNNQVQEEATQVKTQAVFVNAPSSYTLNARKDIAVAVQGQLPDDAYILALAWSVAERSMQDQFATHIDPDAPVISWEQLDMLPLGENELQLIVNSRSTGRIAKVTHTINIVEQAPVQGLQTLRYGFGDAPNSYKLGSGASVPLVVEGEMPNGGDVLMLAWSVTESRMVNAFAFELTGEPWVIPAEKMQLLPVGEVELQLAFRQGKKIKDKVKHLITVDYAVPSVSIAGLADTFMTGQGTDVSFALSNPLPSGAELSAVILNAQGQPVSTHAINEQAPALSASAFTGLAAGNYQLAVVTKVAGDEVARVASEFVVEALPEPETEPVAPAVAYAAGQPTQIVHNDGQTLSYTVGGDLDASYDVVVQAWSITNSALAQGFAYKTAATSGKVPSDRLARLPEGDVVVQVLLRKDAKVIQQVDHRVSVSAKAIEPTVAPTISFAQTGDLNATQGQVPAIDYVVSGSGQGYDLLIMVWSDEQNSLVQGLTRVTAAQSGRILAGQLAELPAGRNVVQIHLRDGSAQKIQSISRRVEVAPSTGTPTEQPTQEEPTQEQPAEDPTTENPSPDTTDQPTTQEPTVEEPTVEEPTVEEPVVDEPAEEPTTQDPTDQGPVDPGADGGTSGSAAMGFTDLSPSSGTQIIYVSSSTGNDNNDGLSANRPVKTPERGYGLLRNNKPDWLLFKAGDTFQGGMPDWWKSGESSSRPMVIGVYGEGARPIFYTNGGGMLSSHSKTQGDYGVRHLRVIGLHAYANQRDPNSSTFNGGQTTETGIRWMANSDDILFEDLKLEFFKDAIVLQGGDWGYPMKNVTVRRCIMVNQYADENRVGHSQGMYITRSENVWVDQCFFDHNGWNAQVHGAERVKFNHNIYCSTNNKPVKVTNCVLARGASHGLQLRPGGVIEHNFFYRNAMACFAMSTDSSVQHNVVMEGVDMTPDDLRGVGIETFSIPNATVSHNIVTTRASVTTRQGIDISANNRIDVEYNIVWDWLNSRKIGVRVNGGSGKFHGNIEAAPNALGAIRFVDPTRDLDRYADHIGVGSKGTDVLRAGANRPRGQWPEELSARSINSYIRAGFDVIPYD